jgi:endonuclease YncB( thermonuclease family)
MAKPQAIDDQSIEVQYAPKAIDNPVIVETGPAIVLPQVESETGSKSDPEATCISRETGYQTAAVVDVIDADRLRVSIEGEISTIKYIGIATNTLFLGARDAALSANQALIGQTITLVKDVSEADGDGNLLRYVFTEDAFINQYFLENGLATASNAPPDEACVEDFQTAEANARIQEVGTWERLKPEQWREWPIVPVISENAVRIYERFLGDSADPESFSIIGDCLSLPERLFQKVGGSYFSLPAELDYLQTTVEQFRSAWTRQPVTVVSGFVAASLFSSYFADPNLCSSPETPINCEFRINHPSIVFISIGTDQKPGTEDDFEYYMREIIEYSLDKGVLPIISTKADPTDDDFPLNYIMAQLAYEYDIPLWNFWATVQHLPNTGLNPRTGIHLTAEANEIRRLSALQVLHAVLEAAAN